MTGHVIIQSSLRRDGLVCSLSRVIAFDGIDALAATHTQAVKVHSAAVAATKTGARIGDVYATIVAAYGEVGSDAWRHSHVGGGTGFLAEAFLAGCAGADDVVIKAQEAFVWMSTIPGTRAQDTYLVGGSSGTATCITHTPDWPMVDIECGDGTILRQHDVLVRGVANRRKRSSVSKTRTWPG